MRFPQDVPVLTDKGIRLRVPRLEDVEAMVEMYRDPDTQYWGGSPPTYDRDEAERGVAGLIPKGWRDGTRRTWVIEYGGEYAGAIALSGGDSGVGSVGFTGHPAYRGKGLTTRAVRLVLAHAFDDLGWNRVTWAALVGNWGSRRVAWRTGFHHFVTASGAGEANGERRDEWIAWIGRDDEREPQNHWWQVPVIETERFRLREYRDSDVDRAAEMSNDQRTLQWLANLPKPFGREDAERYLTRSREGQASGERVAWAVADPDTDELLGDVGVFGLQNSYDLTRGELGYSAHPEARGRGLITAAVARVIEQAFLPIHEGGLGRRRLELRAAQGNSASIRVAEANGFTRAGVLRAADRRRDGSYDDMVIFDLLISDRG
jgi:RimJ/RimL family protein N-acetyltransferase